MSPWDRKIARLGRQVRCWCPFCDHAPEVLVSLPRAANDVTRPRIVKVCRHHAAIGKILTR
jgi:hypothetical protein